MPTVVVSRLVAGNKRFSLRIGTASFQHRANKRTAAGREVSGSSVIPIAYMAHNIPVAMTFRIIAPNLKNIKQNRTCHGFTRVLVSLLLSQQFTLRARPPSHHCILKMFLRDNPENSRSLQNSWRPQGLHLLAHASTNLTPKMRKCECQD